MHKFFLATPDCCSRVLCTRPAKLVFYSCGTIHHVHCTVYYTSCVLYIMCTVRTSCLQYILSTTYVHHVFCTSWFFASCVLYIMCTVHHVYCTYLNELCIVHMYSRSVHTLQRCRSYILNMPGVNILIHKLYVFPLPLSKNDISPRSNNTLFFNSYCVLFALFFPIFNLIYPFPSHFLSFFPLLPFSLTFVTFLSYPFHIFSPK
jgi:hypothetical protein